VLCYTNTATAAFPVSAASWTGGVVTLTVSGTFTAAAPGQQSISVGNIASTGAANQTGYNGTFNLQSVNATGSGTTQITYNLATNPGTYSSGGTVSALIQPMVTQPVAVGANDAVMIVLFAPANGVLTAFPVLNTATGLPYFPCGTSITFAFPTTVLGPSGSGIQALQLGPRAIQAFQFDVTTSQVRKRTPLLSLMVPPGGAPFQTLILPLNVEASF
jgi:hypothetical protein